jgi:hypothetical protein
MVQAGKAMTFLLPCLLASSCICLWFAYCQNVWVANLFVNASSWILLAQKAESDLSCRTNTSILQVCSCCGDHASFRNCSKKCHSGCIFRLEWKLTGQLVVRFQMGLLSCFNTWSECFGHTSVFNWRKPIKICSINSKTSVESAMQLRVQWAEWMNVTCSFPRERSRNVPKQIAAGGKFGFLPLEANLCAKHDIPVCLARMLLQW